MDTTHPFQQENPDPKAFVEASHQWIAQIMPKCQEQLANLRSKPETVWTSRARRIAVNYRTVIDCIHQLRARINAFPPSTPRRAQVTQQLDSLSPTVDAIVALTQAISRDGKSLATLKANPPGIERLEHLILDLSEAATAAENLQPVIKLIADSPETSRLEIVSIQLINEDSAELLSLAEAFIACWKTGNMTEEQRQLIGTAENLISMQHTLQENIKTFLSLSDVLANLKEGKPKHEGTE